jgi:acetyltransferase
MEVKPPNCGRSPLDGEHDPAAGATFSEFFALSDGRAVGLRPLLPEDQALYPNFMAPISREDARLRFFRASRPSEAQIWAFTHFDRSRAAAIAAIGVEDCDLYGIARLHKVEDGSGEFAVMVRSDMKGLGLGRALLARILAAAPSIGVTEVFGLVLPENTAMLALLHKFGFRVEPDSAEHGVLRASFKAGDPA